MQRLIDVSKIVVIANVIELLVVDLECFGDIIEVEVHQIV
jgi:hypothetical protein